MGTFLPIASLTNEIYIVWLPNRAADGNVVLGKGYVDRKSDVSEGNFPFTQRNIIRQAFKMLGARYGWGGTYNGRSYLGSLFDRIISMNEID